MIFTILTIAIHVHRKSESFSICYNFFLQSFKVFFLYRTFSDIPAIHLHRSLMYKKVTVLLGNKKKPFYFSENDYQLLEFSIGI